jgi:hypothetical protein
MGRNWWPWKYICAVYDGTVKKYIPWSEHVGNVAPVDHSTIQLTCESFLRCYISSLVICWTSSIVQSCHSTTFRHLDLCSSSGANVWSHLVGWVRRRPNLGTPYPILVRMVRMTLSLVQCLTEHKALKACGGVEVGVHELLCMPMDSVVSFTPRLLYVLYRVAQNAVSSNICATLYNLCTQLLVVCAHINSTSICASENRFFFFP